MTSEIEGPISWRNWRAQHAGAPYTETLELRLYSEAWFIAEAPDLGPYAFLNGVPRYGSAGMYSLKPAVILRIRDYLPEESPDLSATRDDDYHGGSINDEIAALCALVLDARIAAGPIDREFGLDNDPLGRARTHAAELLPVLPQTSEQPQIPRLRGERDLRDLGWLDRFPHLGPKQARTLIKACRLYQQALWIADASPQMAWLLLVSAVETAAVKWNQTLMTPVERLQRSYPPLAQALHESSDKTLIETVAAQLSNLTGATGKFLGFVTTFAPEPPKERPRFGRLDFDRAALMETMAQVYRYRSRALHTGTPFPHPMCWPPPTYGEATAEETPSGLAAGALGSSWLAKDIPLYLHTFAYIARGALLNWWRAMDGEVAASEMTAERGAPDAAPAP